LTKRRPRRIGPATATAVILLLLLNLVAQPPVRALHNHICSFGPFGIGYGAVWILVEPLNQMEVRSYKLTVLWGSVGVKQIETLKEPTYFTLDKNDLYSGDTAGINVEPPAYLSCGSGDPPPNAPRIPLTGWYKRSQQPTPSPS
jgi:hypothetical protein